jgi:hypothetical protein
MRRTVLSPQFLHLLVRWCWFPNWSVMNDVRGASGAEETREKAED